MRRFSSVFFIYWSCLSDVLVCSVTVFGSHSRLMAVLEMARTAVLLLLVACPTTGSFQGHPGRDDLPPPPWTTATDTMSRRGPLTAPVDVLRVPCAHRIAQ